MNVLVRRGATFAIVALAALLACGDAAHAQTINKCQAGKKKCVIKKTRGLLGCHRKAEARGIPVDQACLDKALTGFSNVAGNGCIDKLEAKGGCLTTGDGSALEAKSDAFVLDVVQELDPAYPAAVLSTCGAGKKWCASKKMAGLLGCHVKAELNGVLDPACTSKALAGFDSCFSKREAKGGCTTTGDVGTIGAKVDAFVDDVVCELDPSEGTCSASGCEASPFPTCGGSCPGDGVCTAGFGVCQCVSPSSPCGGTSPLCNGVCGAGEECAAIGPDPLPGCFCLPTGSTPCGSPGAPICGGVCPSGDVCRPVVGLPVFGGLLGCTCAPPGACGSGGVDCPNGFACGVIPPGSYICAPIGCGGSPAYPTCGGTCVPGATCQAISIPEFSFTQCVCAIPGPCGAGCGGYGCAAGEVCQLTPSAPGSCSCGAP